MHPTPDTSPYTLLGGEAPLRKLVDRFYQIMDEDPRATELRAMHPADLQGSADKLFMFLSGWLGGPGLYEETFGPPMLRRRHMPFPIHSDAAGQWMLCMREAMEAEQIPAQMRQYLDQALTNTARHMVNQAPAQP